MLIVSFNITLMNYLRDLATGGASVAGGSSCHAALPWVVPFGADDAGLSKEYAAL